jgi:hypothetical protein
MCFQINDDAAIGLLHTSAGGVLRQFFAGVLRRKPDQPRVRNTGQNPTVNDYFHQYYATHRPNIDWTDGRYISSHVTFATKQYETNCKNHIVKMIPIKLRQWAYYKLQKYAVARNLVLTKKNLWELSG